MDYTYIEQLIERYFAGETSLGEERVLKAFFSMEDVPATLKRYAPLFAYADEAKQDTLGSDFTERLRRNPALTGVTLDDEAHPTANETVKILPLTFADRIRPLWRSAAAVAIVVLIGGSLQRAYMKHEVEPISPFGTTLEADEQDYTVNPDVQEIDPRSFIQEGEKVAITADTIA